MKVPKTTAGAPLTYGRAVQEKRAKQETTDRTAQPVRVTISKEGLESCRGSLAGGRSWEDAVRQKQLLKDVKLSPDLNYSFRFRIGESLSDEDKKVAGGSMTLHDRMKEMANTYTSLYDEIVQGYESGTREIHVSDPNSAGGYRTLTMEEELDALDAAYEDAVRAREEIEKRQPGAQKAFEDYKKKLEKFGAKRTEAVSGAIERMKHAKTPEKLSERMIASKNAWKQQYPAAPKTALQEFFGAIDGMFRQIQ